MSVFLFNGMKCFWDWIKLFLLIFCLARKIKKTDTAGGIRINFIGCTAEKSGFQQAFQFLTALFGVSALLCGNVRKILYCVTFF